MDYYSAIKRNSAWGCKELDTTGKGKGKMSQLIHYFWLLHYQKYKDFQKAKYFTKKREQI